MPPRAPFWLAAPSRFAALPRGPARIGLAIAAALVLACLLALGVADPPGLSAATGADAAQTDLALYEKIVAGVRGGGGYYEVAADAMRAAGYPLKPFVTMRMPALAVVLGALPDPAPAILLFALALAVGVTWGIRVGEALPRLLPRVAAGILLLGSLLAFLQPGLAAFHEIWAGLLVALSVGVRRPGRWVEAAAIGLAAMLIRETAALYVLVMAAIAWAEGSRREAMGWCVALLLFAVALGVHGWTVTGIAGPLDAVSPGWLGFQGIGLFVKAMWLSTGLQVLPLWAGALLTGLALFGWASWNDPAGLRMAATLAVYALLIALFARLDTFYWGLMVAPLLLLGLAFAPDGIRDLVTRALDRRRITVTRVVR